MPLGKTPLDQLPPVITLNGPKKVYLQPTEPYVELGASMTDITDTQALIEMSSAVVIAGDTVTSGTPEIPAVVFPQADPVLETEGIPGTYVITYDSFVQFADRTDDDNPTDDELAAEALIATHVAAQVTREVIVKGRPEITLNGDNPLELVRGDLYIEEGADIKDYDETGTLVDKYKWSDLTYAVEPGVPATAGEVDTFHPFEQKIQINAYDLNNAEAGEYEVTYNYTDTEHLSAIEVVRVVTVVETATAPVIVT